jgi:hypothetical protein
LILWSFNFRKHGLPNNVRDNGAWVMFDGTPYAHLHICGTPWAGNVYHPQKNAALVLTMQYAPLEPEDRLVDTWKENV